VTVSDRPRFARTARRKASIEIYTDSADVTISGLRLNDSRPVEAELTADSRRIRIPLESEAADYTITLRARQTSGEEGLAVAFGDLDAETWFEWHFGTWKNRYSTLYQKADGYLDELTDPIPFSVERDHDYDLHIRVQDRGRRITCLLDGTTMHETIDPGRPEQRFTASAVRDSETGGLHLKIVNATAESVQAAVEFT
jgi:alpha-L-arabinofuranosidase